MDPDHLIPRHIIEKYIQAPNSSSVYLFPADMKQFKSEVVKELFPYFVISNEIKYKWFIRITQGDHRTITCPICQTAILTFNKNHISKNWKLTKGSNFHHKANCIFSPSYTSDSILGDSVKIFNTLEKLKTQFPSVFERIPTVDEIQVFLSEDEGDEQTPQYYSEYLKYLITFTCANQIRDLEEAFQFLSTEGKQQFVVSAKRIESEPILVSMENIYLEHLLHYFWSPLLLTTKSLKNGLLCAVLCVSNNHLQDVPLKVAIGVNRQMVMENVLEIPYDQEKKCALIIDADSLDTQMESIVASRLPGAAIKLSARRVHQKIPDDKPPLPLVAGNGLSMHTLITDRFLFEFFKAKERYPKFFAAVDSIQELLLPTEGCPRMFRHSPSDFKGLFGTPIPETSTQLAKALITFTSAQWCKTLQKDKGELTDEGEKFIGLYLLFQECASFGFEDPSTLSDFHKKSTLFQDAGLPQLEAALVENNHQILAKIIENKQPYWTSSYFDVKDIVETISGDQVDQIVASIKLNNYLVSIDPEYRTDFLQFVKVCASGRMVPPEKSDSMSLEFKPERLQKTIKEKEPRKLSFFEKRQQ